MPTLCSGQVSLYGITLKTVSPSWNLFMTYYFQDKKLQGKRFTRALLLWAASGQGSRGSTNGSELPEGLVWALAPWRSRSNQGTAAAGCRLGFRDTLHRCGDAEVQLEEEEHGHVAQRGECVALSPNEGMSCVGCESRAAAWSL